ncbi:tetratricopeptide repeat protein [Chthonomonas calidirosea]|uniref:tetratricopeptide repeat protein n=1 Tax=Chthonomonas calidirosea TaxID=454171 RepID=UPI0006DD3C16|nr:tetratricopeptide repeat protein [Chthonomonas calidirosea]CEK19793.1 tetratricopeptide repeat protein [Chthonomonas calidirosea]
MKKPMGVLIITLPALFSSGCTPIGLSSKQASSPEAARISSKELQTFKPPLPVRTPEAPAPPTLQDFHKAYQQLQQHPKDPTALMRYGEMALAVGKVAEGVRALLKAARVAPHAQAPFVFLARLYQDAGYTDLEIEALRHLVSLKTKDPNVYLRLMEIYLELHWLELIPPILQTVKRLSPHNPDVSFLEAHYLFETGHTQQAIRILQHLFAQHPQDEDIAFYLTSYLTAAEQLPEAEQTIRVALQHSPASARLQLLLAYTLERIGDPKSFPEALALSKNALQTALAQKRSDLVAEAYYREGKAYLLLGQTQDALTAFQQSYQTNPAFEDVAFQLGRLKVREGDRAGGTKLIHFYETIKNNSISYGTARDLVNSHFADPVSHLRMAKWYMRLGIYNDAVVEYKEALRLRPSDKRALEGLKGALLAMGRRTEAHQIALRGG